MTWKDKAEQAARDADSQREVAARRDEAKRTAVFDDIDRVARPRLRSWCERVGMALPGYDRQDVFQRWSDPDGDHYDFTVHYRWSDNGYRFEARAFRGGRWNRDMDISFHIMQDSGDWCRVETLEELGQALRLIQQSRDSS